MVVIPIWIGFVAQDTKNYSLTSLFEDQSFRNIVYSYLNLSFLPESYVVDCFNELNKTYKKYEYDLT